MKKINVRLVNNEKDFLKYTSGPMYIIHKMFGEDYAAIHEIKPVLILNKSLYVGFIVVDLSKWKIFITILLKRTLMLNCYLLTQSYLQNKIRKCL